MLHVKEKDPRGRKEKDPQDRQVPVTIWVKQRNVPAATLALQKIEKKYKQ
jgi:hypothetical protein